MLSSIQNSFRKKSRLSTENLIYTIDMGTTSLKVILLELRENRQFSIIDQSIIPYGGSLTPKSFNRDQLRDLLHKTFRMIERHYGLDLSERKALLTLPMSEYTTEIITVQSVASESVITAGQKIELINKAKELCEGTMVLHTIPLKFYVDQKITRDPVGQPGNELAMEIMLIGYNEYLYEQIRSLMKELGVSVGKYVAPPLAFINYYLNMPHPKEDDPLILDFGGESIYCYGTKDDMLVNFINLPHGSELITRDIAKVMKVDPVTAKRLKEDYVDFYTRKSPDAALEIDQNLLHDVVQARYEEFLDWIEAHPSFETMKALAKKVILLGNGHPQKSEILLQKRWGLPVIALEATFPDKGYLSSIGLIHYAINNDIYNPTVSRKQEGFKNKLAQVVEDLF
ncbi:MAG: hypothetical protein AABZ14_01795 [Candidatus Margulisiibacteriota bacterium]